MGQVEVGSTALCREGMGEGQILIRCVLSGHSQALAPEGWGLLVKLRSPSEAPAPWGS